MVEITRKKDPTTDIILQVLHMRARDRLVPVSRYRRITITRLKSGHFRISKYEIMIDREFATTGNPFHQMDLILDAITEFGVRDHQERAKHIVVARSLVMKWAAYLERTLSYSDYSRFIHSLNGGKPDDNPERHPS